MEENYIFYQGWTKTSIDLEDFFKKNSVPYVLIHQEIGEPAMVFNPRDNDFYDEKEFNTLKYLILGGVN